MLTKCRATTLSEQSEEISLFGCDEFRNRFGQMLGFYSNLHPFPQLFSA
ncbi:hypothetical protein [Vibrio cholerae]